MFMGHFWVCHHNPPFFPIVQRGDGGLPGSNRRSSATWRNTHCRNWADPRGKPILNYVDIISSAIIRYSCYIWITDHRDLRCLSTSCTQAWVRHSSSTGGGCCSSASRCPHWKYLCTQIIFALSPAWPGGVGGALGRAELPGPVLHALAGAQAGAEHPPALLLVEKEEHCLNCMA